jgi:hypothetical protein
VDAGIRSVRGRRSLEGHGYIGAVIEEEEEHVHVVAHGVAQDEREIRVDGDLETGGGGEGGGREQVGSEQVVEGRE